MRSKKTSRSSLIKQADKLFSQLIRSRGKCQRCFSDKNLQCAHVVSRVNKHLRWNEDNALSLCLRCHIFWMHKSPLEFSEWFILNFPIQWGFLRREMHKIEPNLGETIEF